MPISRREFLTGAAAATGLAALGAGPARAALHDVLPRVAPGGFSLADARANIDTVVVVMMENRSFDHFLGWIGGSSGEQKGLTYLDDDGVAHATHYLGDPKKGGKGDYTGCGFRDPDHSWNGGRVQLGGTARDNSGFRKRPNDDYALGYYEADDLPVWKALTKDATIFDRYFVSCLGPTYPNRWYMHGASSGGRKNNIFAPNPIEGWPDTTIWDRAEATNGAVTWAYYYSNLPAIGLYGRRLTLKPNVRHISSYYADAALGRLPNICFVDPFFIVEGLANDDHPHADVRLGQQFLSDVIRAFAHSPQYRRGALFVNYDEWGGFFDTVVPPRVPDARASANLAEDFGQCGFRSPAAVVSPFADKGKIASGTYDHTSILRFVEELYGLAPITVRDAQATNIGEVLDFERKPLDPPDIPVYVAPPDARIPCAARGHHGPSSDLVEMVERGIDHDLGVRTDWQFEDSFSG